MARNLWFLSELWRRIETCAHLRLHMVPKRLCGITILSCVRSRKSGDLTCIAAEASNHTA